MHAEGGSQPRVCLVLGVVDHSGQGKGGLAHNLVIWGGFSAFE